MGDRTCINLTGSPLMLGAGGSCAHGQSFEMPEGWEHRPVMKAWLEDEKVVSEDDFEADAEDGEGSEGVDDRTPQQKAADTRAAIAAKKKRDGLLVEAGLAGVEVTDEMDNATIRNQIDAAKAG